MTCNPGFNRPCNNTLKLKVKVINFDEILPILNKMMLVQEYTRNNILMIGLPELSLVSLFYR